MRRASIYRTYEMPSSFYAQREQVCYQLAHCVLIAPDRAPAAAELPRSILPDDLRQVLAWAPMYRTQPARLALKIASLQGMAQVVKILSLDDVFLYLLPWYSATLVELADYEKQVQAAARALAALEIKCGKVAPRSSGPGA